MQNVPDRMRGVWLTGHGGLETLEIRDDIPVPVPGPTDVLINVAAAGVNNTDINTRTGWYSKNENASDDASWTGAPIQLPRIQGADVCGRIAAVGSRIDRGRIGERVLIEPCIREANGKELDRPWYFGSECDGGFAEYTVVAGRHAHRIDSSLSDVELASFPCSYSTAQNLVTRARVNKGDRVMITGASGGVGSAAVQLSKVRGAKVFAVTSPEKSTALKQLGTDEILLRETDLLQHPGRNRIDVVIDLVAGKKWPHFLEVLRPGGRYAASGAIAGPMVALDLRTFYLKDLSLFGCTVLDPGVFESLVSLIEKGNIVPLVDRSYPLEQIREAQKQFMKKRHIGKIVLQVNSETKNDPCGI